MKSKIATLGRQTNPQLSGPDSLAVLRWPILTVTLVILSFAAAYRSLGLGRDYLDYLTYYNTIPPNFSFADTRFEPGFHAVAYFFRVVINVEYQYFAIALIAASLAIKFYLFSKYLHYPLLAAIVYILMVYPLHEYTQIRAAFALSLAFLASHLWYGDKRLAAFALITLAFLFHGSIAIYATIYFLGLFIKFDTKQETLFSISAIFVGFWLVFFIFQSSQALAFFFDYNPLLEAYLTNRALENNTSFFSLTNLLYMSILFGALYGRWFNDNYKRPFLFMSLVSVFALAIFSGSPTIAQRTKEVLFVAIIFAAFRAPIAQRDVPAIASISINALVLGALSIQNGLIFE